MNIQKLANRFLANGSFFLMAIRNKKPRQVFRLHGVMLLILCVLCVLCVLCAIVLIQFNDVFRMRRRWYSMHIIEQVTITPLPAKSFP